MTIKTWDIEKRTGYKPISTFYEDFSIADGFGENAIRDTFKRAFGEWKGDYKMFTELTMALNWKIWEYYQRQPAIAKLYQEMWERLDKWANENLTGEALEYYYRTTD